MTTIIEVKTTGAETTTGLGIKATIETLTGKTIGVMIEIAVPTEILVRDIGSQSTKNSHSKPTVYFRAIDVNVGLNP